jgi:enamine deaminase RidA (YjgF/YER057c/UK114 family)
MSSAKAICGAQIEQVGKNVGACLDAGGATPKDIVFTVSYVTQPAEFDKYADVRERYFGPPSPKSSDGPKYRS